MVSVETQARLGMLLDELHAIATQHAIPHAAIVCYDILAYTVGGFDPRDEAISREARAIFDSFNQYRHKHHTSSWQSHGTS
jgi:hypothetical protein